VDKPLAEALDLAEQAPDELRDAVKSVSSVVSGNDSPEDVTLENSGYVVTTLQAGLYHGLVAEGAEDAIIDAVMMGGDTDTLGAVAGAIAGARFGSKSIDDKWKSDIQQAKQLEECGNILKNRSFSIAEEASNFYSTKTLNLQNK
jgi:ADP-ribosyl-[dinitrogen reductase] hydrolase